jgi:hypothetical protein
MGTHPMLKLMVSNHPMNTKQPYVLFCSTLRIYVAI